MKKLSIIFVLALILSIMPAFQPLPTYAHTYNTIIYSSNSDGYNLAYRYTYADSWGNTTADVANNSSAWTLIGQSYDTISYDIKRTYFFFNTSIPSEAEITAASLCLYGRSDASTTDFLITIQNGQPTYPHNPFVVGDYNKAYYSGDGGNLNTSGFTTSGYNTISLNAGGISWINKGGETKLCIRSSRDIAGTAPTAFEEVHVYTSEEAGTSKDPYLNITYTVRSIPTVASLPASSITHNSARINGNLTDDGGYSCEARFRWLKSADEPTPEWYGNWSYRKPITVTNASASYQTKILIGKNSSAVGENVDCGGHVADDFDDLRFTADEGLTLLDYWVESVADSGGTKLATVWVENNAAANTTLYMYYGGTETAVSSGASTFLTYDDFERGSNGDTVGGAWTEVAPHCHISTEQDIGDVASYFGTRSVKLLGVATYAGMTIPQTAGNNYALYTRFYREAGAGEAVTTGTIRHGNGTKRVIIGVLPADGSIEYYDTAWRDTGTDCAADEWVLLEVHNINFVAGTYDIWYQGAAVKTGAAMQTSANDADIIILVSDDTPDKDLFYDNFIVRKFTAYEPSFAFGGEESYPWTETTWQNSLETGDTFYEDLTGLDSATEYAYQAQARNDAGTSAWTASAYFTTCPAAPTSVSASDGEYTDKVVINWTKSTGATGYKVYRDGGLIQTLGDVATYNDTGADAGVITPGTAMATDGVHTDKVVLSLSGEAASNGTAHNYTVKAFNDSGDSPASSADSGYRSVGPLTYQWMVSAGDADGGYSNIGGATTDPYDYTAAPAGTITPGTADAADGDSPEHIALILTGAAVSDGAGRYYKCTLSATGAADQNSTSDRGYRTTGALIYQWLRSAADSDDTYSTLVGATTVSYNDTTAPAPTINGGNATASDGTSTTIVTLDLANHNATEGDGRYYLCSLSATGTADQNSTSNRGYRGTTSLVLQWLMSAADSDASYSEIVGGTTNPYNDTGGVTEPDGRYYKCVVNMTGATSQNSTSDRGYMLLIAAPNVTNSAATSITGIAATLHGNITSIVGENASTRGFEWGTSTGNYTSNWTEAGNFTTGTFDHAIAGLVPATQYFWRAFAINSAGQGNSSELNFTTLLLPGPPLNFTITQTGSDSITLNWTLGVGANGTEIRVSTIGYPGSVTGGFLVYNGTGTSVAINGLNLDMNTYYYEGWSWNAFGYSLTSAQANIGGAGMEIVIFGILPLGFLALFLWKRLALLAYASAATWGLFGFFALQTSTSPSPTQIQDIYMGLFWVCVALVITMALLPLAMREKKEPEELYVDELDQPLEGKQEKKEPTGIRRQKPSQFAQNGKM